MAFSDFNVWIGVNASVDFNSPLTNYLPRSTFILVKNIGRKIHFTYLTVLYWGGDIYAQMKETSRILEAPKHILIKTRCLCTKMSTAKSFVKYCDKHNGRKAVYLLSDEKIRLRYLLWKVHLSQARDLSGRVRWASVNRLINVSNH